MQKSIEFSNNTTTLDDIGGEPLTGSGFETEMSDAEFATGEFIRIELFAPEEEDAR